MVSNLPTQWTEARLTEFVNTLKPDAQYIFVTDVVIEVADIYASFGNQWEDFIKIVSKTAAQQY